MADLETNEAKRPGTALTTWQEFEVALTERRTEIDAMLPRNVPVAKFQATAIAAVKQNPDLLQCTTRSLMAAITKSAQDGILPDGREGVITSYNTKVSRRNEPDRYAKVAQWNPMAHGLRKRARELDGILIDAQVIYENDKFTWVQGDNPRIEHTPAALGTPRGAKIGAYAIFKRENDGLILAREVMAADEIKAVREQSQAPNSLMWTKFEGEGWRKTVLRRGIKSVPVSEEFENIVRRDDENFSFEPVTRQVIEGEVVPPRPARSDFERGEAGPVEESEEVIASRVADPSTKQESEKSELKPNDTAKPKPEKPAAEERQSETAMGEADAAKAAAQQEFDDWYADQKEELKNTNTVRAVPSLHDVVAEQLVGDPRAKEWDFLCDNRIKEIMAKLREKTKK